MIVQLKSLLTRHLILSFGTFLKSDRDEKELREGQALSIIWMPGDLPYCSTNTLD